MKSLLLRGIRFILCWIFNILYLPVAAVLNVCSLRIFAPQVVYRLSRIWGRGAFAIFGITLDVENSAPLDERSPKILIFNHASTIDVLILAALFPQGGCAVGKKQILYIPFLNIAWWGMGFVFLDRGNSEKSRNQLNNLGAWMIRKKMTMVIAPEGTRSRTGEIQAFKMGAFHIALNTKLPLYPMVIYNAKTLMPRKAILPHPGTIHIKILDPIPTDHWTRENLKEKAEEVRGIFLKELEAYENPPLQPQSLRLSASA